MSDGCDAPVGDTEPRYTSRVLYLRHITEARSHCCMNSLIAFERPALHNGYAKNVIAFRSICRPRKLARTAEASGFIDGRDERPLSQHADAECAPHHCHK
eukprot:979976-Pleurochrysis_carterae.AAC.1